jgi:RNA polymerase sigma-70 factor, ECF subfamily
MDMNLAGEPPACDSSWATSSSWLVTPKPSSGRADESRTTLGDLLYADRTATTPENYWVDLVRAVASGDQRALRALYERTHRLVFTLAVRICGDRERAEEVTLDVFHDVWRRSAQYDEKGGSVVGWIVNQARSRAIDRLRFEQRKKRVQPHPNQGEERPAEESGPGDALDGQQWRGLLQQALTALTSDERQVIETAFFGELTYSETAVRLDQPLGTVKTRVRSALAKLRKALEKQEGLS